MEIKKGKKGVVDVQFNWIFIMIAGFVIFLFIISIVLSQKKNADAQAATSAADQINTILESKQQSTDVYSEISMPSTDMAFRCDPDTKIFNFKIGGADRVALPTAVIFAPNQLETNKIQVWSQEFDMPFPVTTFLYITSSDRAILIYNTTMSSYVKNLYDSLPGNITKKYISDPTQYPDFTNRRIVCFDGDCPVTGVDYLKITPAGSIDYGNVTFHKHGVAEVTEPYMSVESLYGAIFSDDAAYYSCQMTRVFDQFEIKRLLVQHRLELLSADSITSSCKNSLSVALNDQVMSMKDASFNWDNVTNIMQQSSQLATRNSDLIIGSCPTIY